MLDTDALIPEQVVYELRYKGGFLYWDNCGKIWSKLTSAFPRLEMESVSPQEAKLVLRNESINISFSHERLHITQQQPSNLDFLGEVADATVETVTHLLEIETFTRIGNRFFNVLKVNDFSESIEYMKNLGCFEEVRNRTAKFGDIIKDPQIKFVINKGDEKGYIVNVRHQERSLSLTLPKYVKYDTSEFLSKVLLIDIDFFTMKPVDCSIVKSSELVHKNGREIKHLISALFN